MGKLQDAKALLSNKVLEDIFESQQTDVVERFKQANADDVPTLVACNIETRALERLKDCIHETCQRIVDENEPGHGNA